MKIRIISTDYNHTPYFTRCNINYQVFYDNGDVSNTMKMSATSHLKDGDDLDVELGEQIAEAKAYRKLYNRYFIINKEKIKKLLEQVIELNTFNKKAERIIKDQTEDILRLAKD